MNAALAKLQLMLHEHQRVHCGDRRRSCRINSALWYEARRELEQYMTIRTYPPEPPAGVKHAWFEYLGCEFTKFDDFADPPRTGLAAMGRWDF